MGKKNIIEVFMGMKMILPEKLSEKDMEGLIYNC